MDTGFDRAELTEAIEEMTPDQAVKMTRELCARLAAEGAFHGNIWPGSVSIDEDGRAFLGEGSDAPVSQRTAAQVEFLSPEYFWDGEGSLASDVYSLGLLLYAGCNGGYLPFQPKGGALTQKDRSAALRKRMKGEALTVPSGVSEELGAVLQKALAYEPEDRYVDPAALLVALGATDEALPSAPDISEASAEDSPAPPEFSAEEVPAEVLSAAAIPAEELSEAAPAEPKPAEKTPAGKKSGKKSARKPAEKKPAPVPEKPAEPKPAEKMPAPVPEKSAEPAVKRTKPEVRPAEPEVKLTEPEMKPAEPEKKYTVQKDFDRKTAWKEPAAAPASRKKKKASPVLTILSILATAAVIVLLAYFLLRYDPSVKRSGVPEVSAEVSEPVVVLPAESPEATEPPQAEEIHTATADELMGGEEETEPTAAPEEPAPEESVTGSASIDGMDVTPVGGTVYVTGSGVNLRSGPGTSYAVSTTLSRGTKLNRTGAVNGWTQVQYDGAEYYVSSSLVSTIDPTGGEGEEAIVTPAPSAPPAAAPAANTSGGSAYTVTEGSGTLTVTSDVNVRSGPGTGYSVLGIARAGQTLTATGSAEDGKWYRVTYDGKTGYVNRKLVNASGFTAGAAAGTPAPAATSGTLEVIADVNIRSGPGTGYSILNTAKAGETLEFVSHTASNWYEVKQGDTTGYVAGNFVREK